MMSRKEVVCASSVTLFEPHADAAAGRPAELPCSQAIKTPKYLFISGLVGVDPNTGAVEDDTVEGQTRRLLDNMKAILEEAGLTFAHVTRVVVFLRERKDFQRMNNAYVEYFTENPPARTCSTLVEMIYPGARVEMSSIASCEGPGEVVFSAAAASPDDHPALTYPEATAPKAFCSQAIKTPGLMYIGGVAGTAPGTCEVRDHTIEGQTKIAMLNLEETLRAGGLEMNDVVNVLVLLQDRNDFDRMSEVYAEHFPDGPPARCTVVEGEHFPGAKAEFVALASYEGQKQVLRSGALASPSVHPSMNAAGRGNKLPFYSHAVMTPSLLFTSGIVATNGDSTEIADPSVEGQTRMALENLKSVLAEGGLTLADVVNTTVFLRDAGDYAAMNRVYAEYFSDSPPTRSCAVMYDLYPGAKVEIFTIASRE